MNWKTFFICGLTGWCMEILFTSLGGLLRGDLLLNGHTSIWMFPIYGLKWFPVKKTPSMSLGLQQNPLQYFRSCPPRLFSCMVHRRADL